MICITDNTLTALGSELPKKEQLYTFCQLLWDMGVDQIALSKSVYEKMEQRLPKGKYMLAIDIVEEKSLYPGFYRYLCHQIEDTPDMIQEIQMNDARELVKLRALGPANELCIVGLDDLLCESYDRTMEEMRKAVPKSKINFCPENTFGCATALAIQWILQGGNQITTSFSGIKNNGATEQVLMALRLAVRHKPNRDLSFLPKIREVFEGITGKKVGNKTPIIGRDIFKVEAGIHADALRKNPATYEAFPPQIVGGLSEIVIGKHSGLNALSYKMEEMELPVVSKEDLAKLLTQVKVFSMRKRRSLTDQEFRDMAKEVISHEREKIYC